MRTQYLALLGLLMKKPQHGYELKRKIDATLENVAAISSGTLYYTLQRMQDKTWVSGRRERQGNRPERTVYSITSAGRREFQRLLRKSLFEKERPYFSFDLGLFFCEYAGLDVLEEAADAKLADLQRHRRLLEEIERRNPGRWPFHLFFIKERGKLLLESGETWYRRLKDKIRRKRGESNRWKASS
ncbi:MAG: PadR family transcriptional regulator [Planctomycetes bacterium]|nr:PadR family transcriptional regulator [Planctomycetota bacterium]